MTTESPPLRAVLVDDEPLALQGLEDHLAGLDHVKVVATCSNGIEALEAVEIHGPDLLFLDVQMPEMTGFDVLEAMPGERVPAVVFVTAYDEFALNAFEAAAVDYLLKPLDRERVARAVARARRMVDSGTGEPEEVRLVLRHVREMRRAAQHASRLKVRDGDHIQFVPVEDVEWFEADGNYVILHQEEGDSRIRSTLTGLEESLDPDTFVRVHRSVILNLDRLREVQPWFSGDYLAIMKSGEQIRVSRRYKDQLLRDVI